MVLYPEVMVLKDIGAKKPVNGNPVKNHGPTYRHMEFHRPFYVRCFSFVAQALNICFLTQQGLK